MKNKQKFINFLESLKNNGQDALVESVKQGFKVCFESFDYDIVSKENMNGYNIIYVNPNNKMPADKTSQYDAETNTIIVNNNLKDDFKDFWEKHEHAHADYFKKLLDTNKDPKVALETLKQIRSTGYPQNHEETEAFLKQFQHLKKINMPINKVWEYLKKEYKDRLSQDRIDYFNELLTKVGYKTT